MRDYNYGIHADLGLLGQLDLVGADLNIGSGASSWAIEFHLIPDGMGVGSLIFNSRASGTRSWSIDVGGRLRVNGFSGEEFTSEQVISSRLRPAICRIQVIDGVRSAQVFNNGLLTDIDMSSYTGSMPTEMMDINGTTSAYRLALAVAQRDTGSGLEDAFLLDPSMVSDGAGGFVPRGDAAAEAGSEYKLYDIIGGRVYDAQYQVPGAFSAVYDITDVNSGTIELGESGVTVTMSNEITPTDLYFTDGNKEYRPIYSQSGATFTFDVPLTSDDTIPDFGALELVIVDADGTYSKQFEFSPPAGYTLVTLENPVELDESSYTYGTGLNPISGDHYFHQPTSDFSISVNNVWSPVGDAPWSHTVWYLSDAGLRETTASDGQVVVDPNDPPTVDAGAPRTATVGDTVQFGTNVTITEGDGAIDSLLWTQQAGPTVSINNAGVKNASATFSQAGSYEFPLTATDSNGETGSDILYITVNEAVTDSTLNATITNIPDGTYDTRILSGSGEVLFFGPKAWSSESASFTLTDVPAGTDVEYYVIGSTEGGIDRGVTE